MKASFVLSVLFLFLCNLASATAVDEVDETLVFVAADGHELEALPPEAALRESPRPMRAGMLPDPLLQELDLSQGKGAILAILGFVSLFLFAFYFSLTIKAKRDDSNSMGGFR